MKYFKRLPWEAWWLIHATVAMFIIPLIWATFVVPDLFGSIAQAPGDGVINVITGSNHEVTKALLQSHVPSIVTMIGSTRAGLEVMRSSCSSIKHFSVELGGNALVVVYPDADIREAANKVVDLKFANTGQVCVCPNRCFVHESVCEEFVQYAKERAASVQMGPMITG